MKVYFLITGLLRTFIKSLYPFLNQLKKHIEYEFIIFTSHENDDSKYSGISFIDQINEIIKNKNFTLHVETPKIDFPIQTTQREKNTIYQWYRIDSVIKFLISKNICDTDIVVRIRPDVNILSSVEEFIEIINKAFTNEGIYIPLGNDLFSETFRPYVEYSINDQIAIGQYKYMKQLCSLYSEINLLESNEINQPIISEQILYNYLKTKQIPITRISLPYSIYLSECKIIAISGDSGVGKSTLVKSLHKIFPYDSNLILETDRYHKWERGNNNWQQTTHLHPDANYLELLTDDTYRLKMGESIETIDYDHTCGKFTELQKLESKPFVLLCGLHTLYKTELRSSSDINIFIDVDLPLKRFWKLHRDIIDRKYSFEKANSIFQTRLTDFKDFIQPQKDYADIVIYYSTNDNIPEEITKTTSFPNIDCTITIANKYNICVDSFLQKSSKHYSKFLDKTIYSLKDNMESSDIIGCISHKYNKYLQIPDSSYLGIIQYMMILILFQPE